jgi:hypothetical protein
MALEFWSARIEPLFDYAQNRPSSSRRLLWNVALPTTYADRDRFAAALWCIESPHHRPGQSFVRGPSLRDDWVFTEIFWGPGIRQALLFDANAAGFPHAFGTSHGMDAHRALLRAGHLRAAEESKWAPTNPSASRPDRAPLLSDASGSANRDWRRTFYHRRWVKHQIARPGPFGVFYYDPRS